MARVRVIQNSLNCGEWSPLLEGRSDLAKYHSAAKTVENLICAKFGGVSRRPGTHFVAEVKASANKTRLIPFIFSTVQAYVIELGNLYMRFYRNNGRVENPPGVPVELGSPNVPYTQNFLFDIHFAQSADTLYLAHALYPPRKLTRTSDISWTCVAIDFQDGPYLPEMTDLTITPSAVTGAGITLTASSAVFQAGHVGSIWRLKHGTTWGYAKVTAFTNSTHVTATVVKDFGAATPSLAYREGAWSTVRGFPGSVTLFQQRSWWGCTANNPDTIWGSQTSEYENMDPGTALDDEAVTFTLASNKVNAIRWIAPSRALLVGTTGQEWNISGGDPTVPITPANPNARAETTHGSNLVSPIQVHNAILFLQKSGNRLREYTYDFPTDSYSAPDMTLLCEHVTKGGIVQMDYQQERDSVIWLVRADGTLVGITYERQQDVVAAHRHITGTIGDLSDGNFESVAVIPHPTVDEDQTWVIVKRRFLAAPKSITSWSSVPFGGDTFVTFIVPGHGFVNGQSIVISGLPVSVFNGTHVVSLAIDANSFKILYGLSGYTPTSGTTGFVVDAAGPTTKRYVEYLDTQGGFYGNLETDAALTYSGVAVATLSGLTHLEGQIVDILGNGAVYPQQAVVSGQVTGLSPMVTQAEVGLHFDSKLLTMRPEAGGDAGTAQGGLKRWNSITVRLNESIGVTINGDRVEFRRSGDPMDSPVPLSSLECRVSNLGWDRDGRIEVKQDQPLPLNVLAIIGTLSTNE